MLLFGHTGLIGKKLIQSFLPLYDTLYLYSRDESLLIYRNGHFLETIPSVKICHIPHYSSFDVVVNCIGSYKGNTSFFDSNINTVYLICRMIHQYSLTFPSKKITFLHLSTIGVCNPYSLTQGNHLNHYEASKLCAEYIIESSFRSSTNVSYLLLRPSTVLHDHSILNKYFLLFLFFPFRINSDHFIVPFIYIDDLAMFIVQKLLNQDFTTSTLALSSIHLHDLHLSFVRKSRIYKYLSCLNSL